MAIYVANNGQLQTIKGIYYGMTEDYINATRFHNLVPKTATEIKFLYASDNPDLTDYQRIGYADNNNFIEIWNSGTKYILINPRKNYIYAPVSCYLFLYNYTALSVCVFNNFDTQNVTNMSYMFYGCSSLTTLDVSNFNTENVTSMYHMFYNCQSLSTLDISNFNTESVTSMYGMFMSCSHLIRLDLSRFNTADVTDMAGMFNGCVRLKELYLNNFNTSSVTTMYAMFYYCSQLVTIISNTFNLTSLSNSNIMFAGCTSLIGGNGTTYSSSHTNAEYARVDGENGLQGYFTAPTN